MLKEVRNPVLKKYIREYREIYDSFTAQVEQFGVPFAESREEEIAALRAELRTLGVTERNQGASLVHGRICGACAGRSCMRRQKGTPCGRISLSTDKNDGGASCPIPLHNRTFCTFKRTRR